MKCPVWQLRIPEDHWCRWPWLQWLSCTAPIKARTLSETVCGSEYRFPKRSSALWLSHKISRISSSGPLFSGPFWLCKMCGSTWLVASGHNRKSQSPWWVGFPPPQAFPLWPGPVAALSTAKPLSRNVPGVTIVPQTTSAGGLSKQPTTVLWRCSVVQVTQQIGTPTFP